MSKRPYTGVQFYAVRTNPRCERRVELGLIAEGFGVYLPKETRWRKLPARLYTRAKRENRPKERAEHPLMPGYLFVQVDHDRQSFATIRAVHGVHSLVGVEGAPLAIHPGFIRELQERQAEGEFDHTGHHPTFTPDQQVRVVKAGSFSGLLAKVKAETPEGRIRLMLEGAFIKGEMEFDVEQVEKAA